MVDISSQNNKINVTVSSSGNTANTNVTSDSAMYYSNKSKEWAISNRIVDNTDYSSKYYANESKKQADISTAKATEVVESGNTAVSNINSARDNAIIDVNTAGATQVANVNSAGTTQVNLAKEQVTLATNQANVAKEQATIATNKTSEVVASGNEALSNIDTAKNNAITSITNQETTSKNVLIDEGATQVGLIQNEGATQVANVQSTGFYMRDDKLYFINSQGEETEFKSGGSGGRNVGEIITSSLPLTDAGLHLLDGSLILGGGIYQGFVDYIAGLYAENPSANYFTTESEWQSSVTQYGSCGKFVYNATNNTVRLPKLGNQIYTTGQNQNSFNVDVYGNGKTLGLINGNGSNYRLVMDKDDNHYLSVSSGSPANVSTSDPGNTYQMPEGYYGVNTDPLTSGIVGNVDLTNLSHSETVYYYIVIATSTKTDIEVDIDEIATDLNGKADVDASNFNATGTTYLSGLGMPSSRYIDLTLGASGTTYTAPANGWVIVGKRCTANQYLGTYSNTIMKRLEVWNSSYCSLYFPVKKGDIFPISYTAAGTTEVFRFIYAQGSESEAS